MAIRLCVFDFDSTLMDGETITHIAHGAGVGEEVAQITHRAMAGELDFFESLTARAALVKGLPLATAQKICENLPFITGAAEIISYLNSKGVMTAVFSGGYHLGTDPAQKKLGFGINFANELHHKDGILTGLVGGEMMFGDSKGKMLKRLKEFLGLNASEVAAIGDGANDISMFKEAGIGIAFCAHKVLKDAATHIVDTKDLRELKQIL